MNLSRTVFLALACGACATTPAAPEPEYKPTGEIVSTWGTASFDEGHVRGPSCNLKRREDGTWGGTLGVRLTGNRAVDVTVDDATIRGVDFLVSREESRPGHAVYTGTVQGFMYRFELDSDRALVRTPNFNQNFDGRTLSEKQATYGSAYSLQLRGDASLENPPWPQLALALIAAFN
jgi:hypothetical protein